MQMFFWGAAEGSKETKCGLFLQWCGLVADDGFGVLRGFLEGWKV